MQPLVSSVTLVTVWSRSDGYACKHVYMHAHSNTHAHTGTLFLTVVASLQNRHTPDTNLSFCIQITTKLLFFFELSRRGLKAAEHVRQGLDAMRPVTIPPP